jgi:hypothetical protein
MSLPVRMVSAVVVCALLLQVGTARASLPGIPGVPGVPTVKQATQAVVSKAIVKSMGETFVVEQPVRVSLSDAYPTVDKLPGGPFRPTSQAQLQRFFSQAHDGHVRLPVGDYAISVMTYCMNLHAHAPHHNKYRLAPITGKWADIVAALNGRVATRYSPGAVQVLSWSLQAGMKYSEMSSGSRRIVDAVLPEYKPRLQQSFYEVLRQRWAQLSANVPGVPSFDQALNQMGDVGKAIKEVRDARNTLIVNANDFDRIAAQFANIGTPRVAGIHGATPWSVIAPGVYARMRNRGSLLSLGVLQIRVTSQAAFTGVRVAAAGTRGLAKANADAGGTNVPIPTYAGSPDAAVQPLSMTPRPGDAPDPGLAGSGGVTNGGSGNTGGDTNGPDSGGNSGPSNLTGNNAGTSGGFVPSDDDDEQSSCDPPDNMFGVDQGQLISTSASGMRLGRGAGDGIVCLLLRPFIDLAPLGWPERGSAEVDYGTVGYGVPGLPRSNHIVFLVHYTYATTGDIVQPYVKKHITALIDYGDVTAFCPELAQTLQLSGTTPIADWLSGDVLESRLCITAMTGQTMQINARVIDGDAVGPASMGHAVDPQTFLYEDGWGHY